MTRANADTKWLTIAIILTLPLSFVSIIGSLFVIIPHSKLTGRFTNPSSIYRPASPPLACISEGDIPFLFDAPVNTFLENPHICLEFNGTTSVYSFEAVTRTTHAAVENPYMTEFRMKSGESILLEVDETQKNLNFSIHDSDHNLIRELKFEWPVKHEHRNLEEVSEAGLLFRNGGRNAVATSPAFGLGNAAFFGNGGGLVGGFGGEAIRQGFRNAILGSAANGVPMQQPSYSSQPSYYQPSYGKPSYNPYGGYSGMRPMDIYNGNPAPTPAPTPPSFPSYPNTPSFPNFPYTPSIPAYPITPPNYGDKPASALPAFPYMPFSPQGEQPVLTQYSHQYTKVPGDSGRPTTEQHYYSSLMNPTNQNLPKSPQEFGYDPQRTQEQFSKQFQDLMEGMQDTTNPWASYDMGDVPSASNMDVL